MKQIRGKKPAAAGADVLAAIDVGTNAVRLEMAKKTMDGDLEPFHQERDPIRPGEGSFETGGINKEVADRLIATLRRYHALCIRYKAKTRAVATSALRDARNRTDILRRVRREAGVELEVISGQEEARLIALGVMRDQPPNKRAMCIDVGGGSTEIAIARGPVAEHLQSVDLGAVRLAEMFAQPGGKAGRKSAQLMRQFVIETFADQPGSAMKNLPRQCLGSSGTIQAVVGFARAADSLSATRDDIDRALNELGGMTPLERRKHFDARRAEIIVAGASIVSGAMHHFGLERMVPVDRGLRDGLLVDLLRGDGGTQRDDALVSSAREALARFHEVEAHGLHVAHLATQLFDQLASVHQLPLMVRSWLEVAALLHDIGHTVSRRRHHKHSEYMILNMDFPSLDERARAMVALIARFHRRSLPALGHELVGPLTGNEQRILRRCVALLRVADSLDRGHGQAVKSVRATVKQRMLRLELHSRRPIDLEMWDVQHELRYFQESMGLRTELVGVAATRASTK